MEPKISIWFSLEYWTNLKICHLLDLIHIFKKVGHSLRNHLVGLKDTLASRASLEDLGSKPHLLSHENLDMCPKLALSSLGLTPKEIFRTPIGHGASLWNIFTVDDTAVSGLKTHEWLNFLRVTFCCTFGYLKQRCRYVSRNI